MGGGAPVYIRESKIPGYIENQLKGTLTHCRSLGDLQKITLKLLALPNIASKRWVFEQYDSMVRTDTRVGPSSDAAIVRINGTEKLLAMKTDCNSRYVYLNPKIGADVLDGERARNAQY